MLRTGTKGRVRKLWDVAEKESKVSCFFPTFIIFFSRETRGKIKENTITLFLFSAQQNVGRYYKTSGVGYGKVAIQGPYSYLWTKYWLSGCTEESIASNIWLAKICFSLTGDSDAIKLFEQLRTRFDLIGTHQLGIALGCWLRKLFPFQTSVLEILEKWEFVWSCYQYSKSHT